MLDTAHLPGNDLVNDGISDLAAGRETELSLLVAMAAPRLRAIGIEVPPSLAPWPSHRLYQLLVESGADAHSTYNALVGRIVSFARAAEHATAGGRGSVQSPRPPSRPGGAGPLGESEARSCSASS